VIEEKTARKKMERIAPIQFDDGMTPLPVLGVTPPAIVGATSPTVDGVTALRAKEEIVVAEIVAPIAAKPKRKTTRRAKTEVVVAESAAANVIEPKPRRAKSGAKTTARKTRSKTAPKRRATTRKTKGLVTAAALEAIRAIEAMPAGGADAGRAKERVADPARSVRSGALPYIGAIDGLRALAVTAVLLYHSGLGWLPGGFLGVEVFFVISGYLITSLLLADRAKNGKVSLIGFWKRRARRLLPAAFTLIVATLVYSVVFLPDEVAALRGNALAAFVYASNWYQIFHSQSYFESLGRPSLLKHLWSLGVEEQFYLVWPIVFSLVLARLRRRYAFALIVCGAIASSALMFYEFDPAGDPSRIYYGTDTRAGGLLIGAALAFAWQAGNLSARANRVLRWAPDVCGVLAISALTTMTLLIHETDALLYRGGFAIVGLATAALIAAAVHPDSRVLRNVLGRQPLLWLGTRSYSIYLWHWPVFMLTRPGFDIQAGAVPIFALRLVITVVIAELSYRLVEMPVRRGALGRMRQSLRQSLRLLRRPTLQPLKYRPLAATGFAGVGVLFLGVSVAAAGPPAPPSYLAVGEVQTYAWSRTHEPTPSPDATPGPGTIASGQPSPNHTSSATPTPVHLAGSPGPAGSTTPVVTATVPPTAVPSPPPTSSPPPPLAQPPSRVLALGDSVMLGAAPQMVADIPNLEMDAAVSRQVSAGISLLYQRRDAGVLGDVVIIHLGTNGTFTTAQFDEIMGILSGVERVVWVNLHVPRDWEAPDNDTIAEGVARYPKAVLVDWNSTANAHPEFFYDDEIHLRPGGADYYAQMIATNSR
jgi:peptidoglycan/LPS O-acetylase OafA/YrhL